MRPLRLLPNLLALLLLPSLGGRAVAGPLQQANINRIVNDVRVVDPRKGPHPAALQELVEKDLGVQTGLKSRAELLFQDNTLTRLGAETFFSFQPGTRDLTLKEGTMLLQVPKGLGGAKIRTAAVTAAITGTTILMEYYPGKIVKVLVLEGSLRLSLNNRLGETITLTPGRMLMMKPGDKRLPDPIDVDLAKIIKTSTLVKDDAFARKSKADRTALPSMGLIDAEIARQQAAKGKAGLVDTNLIIEGGGNTVTVATAEKLAALESGKLDLPALNPGNPAVSGLSTGAITSRATDALSSAAAGTGTPSDQLLNGGLATNRPNSTTETPAENASSNGTTGSDGGSNDGGVPTTPTTPPPPSPPLLTLSTITSSDPYLYTAGTAVNLYSATITTGGTQENGAVYYHATATDTPTNFLFGSTTANDTQFGLDSTFGLRGRTTPPAGGVAVFRFNNLRFAGAGLFNGTGAKDLALISLGNIDSAASSGDLRLGNLYSVFLGADAGNITLTNKIVGGTTFKALDLYSRTGNVSLSGDVDLTGAGLYVNAGSDAIFNGKIKANRADVFALGNITIADSFVTNNLTLRGTTVSLGAKTTANVANITATTLLTGSDLAVSSGVLTIGSGGITAPGFDLTGFTSITSQGDVAARKLTATGAIDIGGKLTLSSSGGSTSLQAGSITIGSGIFGKAASGSAKPGLDLTLSADSVLIAAGAGGINGINLEGSDRTSGAAGDGGTLTIGTDVKPIAGDVTINALVSVNSGDSLSDVASAGKGGTVSVTSNGQIKVGAKVSTSESSSARPSSQGGNVRLVSKRTSGAAITVENSGQLLSLLSATAAGPGGKIEFVSAGGDILVNGGTVQADRGTVDIRNNGNSGLVTLTNATMSGDVVKVGALGQNGRLVIGGGTIDANSAIKLYAPGSNGTVQFVDNVTLSGTATKSIAANSVTINDNVRVTIQGKAPDVYTNNPNFSGSGGNFSTTGRFTGGSATVKPLNDAPGF